MPRPSNDNVPRPANDNIPRKSQSAIWRQLIKPPSKAAARRAAAAAAIRAGARAVPYVGAAIAAIEIAIWLYGLFKDLTCGTTGNPGDVRTCFGLEQLGTGKTTPEQDLAPGQVSVNFYRFRGLNGPYYQWRSIGRGRLINPWDPLKPLDQWKSFAPAPAPGIAPQPGYKPWIKLDPFERSPDDPWPEVHPSPRQAPRRRANPYRSPSEQSDWGNEHPDDHPAPVGWPRGWPYPRIEPNPPTVVVPNPTPNGPPIVVPLPQPGTKPNPRPRPEPDVGSEPTPRPRPRPRPDPKPRRRVEWDREPPQKRPPRRGEKERKATGNATPRWIVRTVNTITELTEIVDSAWDALPCDLRRQLWSKGGRAGTRFLTPDEKLWLVYKHHDKLSLTTFIDNLAYNALEDRIFAGLSNMENKNRQALFDRYGLDTPTGNMAKISAAQRGLKEIAKQLKLRKEGNSAQCKP